MITLAALSEKIKPINATREFTYKEAIPQSEDTGMKRFGEMSQKKEKKRKRDKQESNGHDLPTKKQALDDDGILEFNDKNGEINDMDLDRFD